MDLTGAYEKAQSVAGNSDIVGKYFCQKFIGGDQIGEAYAKANIVLARSGAHTVSEVVALNKRALFIPIPWVSHNEQYLNASFVKDLGLCEILNESDLTQDTLISSLENVKKLPAVTVDNSYRDLGQKAAQNILNDILLAHQKKKN